ncbi:hypothetical protein MNBD_NITROSPINAE04-360 [hydrothermal vent metagenome]|uniref:Cytochrome c domain-containing protein n=1 Tax=hydrothermal vent metagenome TaxID=652676 RepID=A0A3B1C366_9ZZZZ
MVKVAVLAIIFLFASAPHVFADAAAGKAIFEKIGKCENCHKITAKQKVGPGLAGISKRTPEKWLKAWLKDYLAVWKANEGYTKTLKKTMGKESKPKPTHKVEIKLSDQQINDLIEYLNTL